MSIKFIELAGGLNYSSAFHAQLFRSMLQTFNNLTTLVVGEEGKTAVRRVFIPGVIIKQQMLQVTEYL